MGTSKELHSFCWGRHLPFPAVMGQGWNGVLYSMSLPVLVFSCACWHLHKVHGRTSARNVVTRWTPASLPTPYPLEGILQQSLPRTTSCSSMSLWPAPGAVPWCLLPQGFQESHLLHWCSADCWQWGNSMFTWPTAPSLHPLGEALGQRWSCCCFLHTSSPLWTQLPEALAEITQCKQL